MKLLLAILLAVLAVSRAEDGTRGVAYQIYKAAVFPVVTGTSRDPTAATDAAKCADCISNTDETLINLPLCADTCGNTFRRAVRNDILNINTNKKVIEDVTTAECIVCLYKFHHDRGFNLNNFNRRNEFGCTTKCRTIDLDKTLRYLYSSKVDTGAYYRGGLGGKLGSGWL